MPKRFAAKYYYLVYQLQMW